MQLHFTYLRGNEAACTGLQDSRTGPLLRDEGPSNGPIKKTAVQRSMLDYLRPNINVRGTENVARGDTAQDMMYDMANNVSVLRDMRGTCRGVSGRCQEHGEEMKRVTQTKMIWTRNMKTGLFNYKKRKVSVVRCVRHMATLVGTMGMPEGAGVCTGSAGHRGEGK